ncbi:3-deoxy-manno-octulosonate cytidylyltransferase [Striga asiatica]|uniref:3-deoxy-manno-octulosonate cytidylyltransferase n=1 Tax=Striga asiatica TaxID=4170 RepID=A0A5A7PAE5_STRAF|nr:3-deoxy-manno-octulosonate cytidylyltransferase [Striga asiatica]
MQAFKKRSARKHMDIIFGHEGSDFLTVLQREDHDNGLDATLDDEVSTPIKLPSQPQRRDRKIRFSFKSVETLVPRDRIERTAMHTSTTTTPRHIATISAITSSLSKSSVNLATGRDV